MRNRFPSYNYPHLDAFRAKKENFSIFAPIHQLHSPNHGLGSVFMFRECPQSIPRIKLPLYGLSLGKIFLASKKFFGPQKSQKCTFFTHPIISMVMNKLIIFFALKFSYFLMHPEMTAAT
jgi:hypothetical protein